MRRHECRRGKLKLAPQVLLLACVVLAGCGSVGEPLYPALKIPTRVSDLTAVERGDKLDIRFTIPPLTTEGLPLKSIGSVELRIGPSPAGGFQINDWASGAQRIDVPTPALPGSVQADCPVRDLIGKEMIVGVRVSNPHGRMSEWSNFYAVNVEPPLATPTNLRANPVPEGVHLAWAAPDQNAFRIFRKAGDQREPSLLATSDKPEYLDSTTQYGTAYQYYLQAIRGKTESDVVESNSITPQDIFPPHVPTGLTASAGVGAVELAWDRNTESDFKEYRVFRSEENGPFTQVAAGLEGPAYSDHAVQSGKRYRYQISAIDRKGNTSQPSEPVEVTVP